MSGCSCAKKRQSCRGFNIISQIANNEVLTIIFSRYFRDYINMHIYNNLHFLLFPMISCLYTQLVSSTALQLINKTQFTSNDQRVVNF